MKRVLLPFCLFLGCSLNIFSFDWASLPRNYFYLDLGTGLGSSEYNAKSAFVGNIGYNLDFDYVDINKPEIMSFFALKPFIEYNSVFADQIYLSSLSFGVEIKMLMFLKVGLVPTYHFDSGSFTIDFLQGAEIGYYFSKSFGMLLSADAKVNAAQLFDSTNSDKYSSYTSSITLSLIFNPTRAEKIIRVEHEQRENELRQQQQREQEIQKQRENEFRTQQQKTLQAQQERERQEKEGRESESAYNSALESGNVSNIVDYIKLYRNRINFKHDSYVEIARILSKNRNVKLLRIPSGQNVDIANPYNFDEKAIYYCEKFSVKQWVGTSFLADLSNGILASGDSLIYVREAYDITKLGRTINNAYLRYVGTETYIAVSGAHTVVPKFDLLYSF